MGDYCDFVGRGVRTSVKTAKICDEFDKDTSYGDFVKFLKEDKITK